MSMKELDARYRELDATLAAMRKDGRDQTEGSAYLALLREAADVSSRRIKAAGITIKVMRATGE